MNWIQKPQPTSEQINTLATDLGIEGVLVSLLIQRGVHNFQDAKSFFRPG